MSAFLSFVIFGLFTGAAYAIAASGLVLTYSTTRIFNIGHGAIGMVLAFVYWDLSQRQDLPTWLALALTLLVVGPVLGMLVYQLQLRGFADAPLAMTLVATLGVFVGLIGVAQVIWPPTPRIAPPFFEAAGFDVVGVFVTWHQVATVLLSGVVALGLYLLLNRSRTGAAMRAAVDNRDLLLLLGGRPQLISTLAFAIAASLAGLAGILLTPDLGLDYYQLTFLVVNAYAAAMFGKLTNLPRTFVGALTLGVLQSLAVGYLPSSSISTGLRDAIPTLFLFAILVLLPQAPLRVGQVRGMVSPRVPSMRRALAWGLVLLVVVALLVTGISRANVLLVGLALVYGLLMLSMLLLTGYAGYVSLCQLTFAGVGAVVYARADIPGVAAVVTAVLVAAAVGALVALPVLRLTGLYLALATMAFGLLMDKLVFTSDLGFGDLGGLTAGRPSLAGLDLTGDGAFVFTTAVLFVALAVALLAVRRARLGRILVAIRDSPAACSTLGLNMNWLRVGVFAASAGIAGLSGAMFAGLRGTISTDDFMLFASLSMVLVAFAWGITTVTGALVAATFLMFMPVAADVSPLAGAFTFLFIGFGAAFLAWEPNGVVNRLFVVARWVWSRVPDLVASRTRRAEARETDGATTRETTTQHEKEMAGAPA